MNIIDHTTTKSPVDYPLSCFLENRTTCCAARRVAFGEDNLYLFLLFCSKACHFPDVGSCTKQNLTPTVIKLGFLSFHVASLILYLLPASVLKRCLFYKL